MLVVTTENIPGKKYEVIGTAFGVTTQSRNIASDFGAGLKRIVGGEIKGYTNFVKLTFHYSKNSTKCCRYGVWWSFSISFKH